MKSMLVLACTLVVASSAAFAQDCPQSRTSNDNAAGLGGSTHGRFVASGQAGKATAADCFASSARSETSNANVAGMGGSTHGRRF
jgi:opacity protein-like surface antigen